MEFGTCTFEGAPAQGGMGWNVVDYTKQPPRAAFHALARAYGNASSHGRPLAAT